MEAVYDTDKAELLNSYFCRQSSIYDTNQQLPQPIPDPDYTLSTIAISPTDVIDAISHINPTKASGPDLISPRLIYEAKDELSLPLSTFFSSLIRSSHFPSAWKLANVAPIFKKADPSNPQNYRPISSFK